MEREEEDGPWPPNFLLQGMGRAGELGDTAHPSGLPGLWARRGRGQPAGQVLRGRPKRRLRPPALPLAPAPHGRVAESPASPAP